MSPMNNRLLRPIFDGLRRVWLFLFTRGQDQIVTQNGDLLRADQTTVAEVYGSGAPVTITELPAGTAASGMVVAADDAAGTITQKVTLGSIANLYSPTGNLGAIAGQATAADRLTYWTGSQTAALATLTPFARTILDDTTANAVRTTISAASANQYTTTGLSLATLSFSTLISGPDLYLVAYAPLVARNDGTPGPAGTTLWPLTPPRMWANVDCTTGPTITGTYSQSGTTVTVTVTTPANYTHGYIFGAFQYVSQSQKVYLDFTSGTSQPTDGLYTCTEDATSAGSTLASNQFKVTVASSTTTSGNVTIRMRSIRQSSPEGVQSITYNGVGDYFVNFTTFFPDANYVPLLQIQRGDAAGTYGIATVASTTGNALSLETGGFRVRCFNSAGTAIDPIALYITVIR